MSWRDTWTLRILPRINSALAHAGHRVMPLSFEFLLQQRLLRRSGDFFFVQVGAFDGASDDPLHRYVTQLKLRGALVEPQPQPFAALRANYAQHPQVQLFNVAIAESDGVRDFYRVRSGVPSLPAWSQQLASFDRANIVKHKHGIPAHGIPAIPDIEQHIAVEPVTCLTFASLLQQAGAREIDLLQIDAEGYDVTLVRAFPFHLTRPALIRYEHLHSDRAAQADCVRFLKQLGYRLVFEPSDTLAYLP